MTEQTSEEQLVSKYELMVILLPDFGEEQTKKEIEDIKKNIKQSNGEISNEDLWGVRDLAYKIRKQEKGFYFVLNFTINPEEIKELEKALILNPKVIRHLLLKIPKNYEIKTLSFYEEEAEKEAEEEKTLKQEKIEAKEKRLKKPEKVEKKEPKKEEKAEEKPKKKKTVKVKEEKIEEKAEEKPKKKRTEEVKEVEKAEKAEKAEEKPKTKELEEKSLEDIDAKLKSIIDDPDITL